MCIMRIPVPNGISLQMRDLFSSNSLCFPLIARLVCSWPFLVRTRPFPRSQRWRAIGRPVAGNYDSNCDTAFSYYQNSWTCWGIYRPRCNSQWVLLAIRQNKKKKKKKKTGPYSSWLLQGSAAVYGRLCSYCVLGLTTDPTTNYVYGNKRQLSRLLGVSNMCFSV